MRVKRRGEPKGRVPVVPPNVPVQCPQCGLHTAQMSDGSRSCTKHGNFRELHRGADVNGPKRYVFEADENREPKWVILWGPYAGSGSTKFVAIDESRACEHDIGLGDACTKCGKSGKLIAMEGTDD